MPRESGASLSLAAFDLTIYHVNIQSFNSQHQAELVAHLSLLPALPILVFLTESWLDSSCTYPTVSGYTLIARRDRHSLGGGVLIFALDSHAHLFSPLVPSPSAEILWLLFHSDCGPLLLCCFYRPPCYAEVDTLHTLMQEWRTYSELAVGSVLIGDFNVHQKDWLYYSHRNTPEGIALRNWSISHGFFERVRKPTRGRHLLDLVLTDMPDLVAADVLATVADHSAVLVHIVLSPLTVEKLSRQVWVYKCANWSALRSTIREQIGLGWTVALQMRPLIVLPAFSSLQWNVSFRRKL